jgi:hypothetical protein
MDFDLYVGILFHVANEIMGREIKFSSTSSCHFEINVLQLAKSKRLFHIDSETNLESLREDVDQTMNEFVVPFFNQYTKIEDCLDLYTKYESYAFDIKPFIGLTPVLCDGTPGLKS